MYMKLKLITIHESVPHEIRQVAFVVSNLFPKQQSKVIKATKHLKSTI